MVQLKRRFKQRRALAGFHKIADRWVYTDSLMEAAIIKRLEANGFHDKWHRYQLGVGVGIFRYTPDVHLSVLHDNVNRRALVELKPFSASDFKKKDRLRMLAAAKFYKDAICLLYVEKKKQWYFIEIDGSLTKTECPLPGILTMKELPRPRFMVPVMNRYGRLYWERPGMFVLRKVGDGIGFMVQEVFGTKPVRRRRRW